MGELIERSKVAHGKAVDSWSEMFLLVEERLSSQNPWYGYNHVDASLRTKLEKLDGDQRQDFLSLFLLWNIIKFDERFSIKGFADELRFHYCDAFHRLMDRIENGSLESSLSRDSYLKELGLTRLTLIPAIAQVIYPFSGVQASVVAKNGFSAWWYVYARCGGRRPFLEIHTHDPWVPDYFNEKGWEETYRLAAMVLEAMPKVKGMVGSSWFYDPQLDEISPRLSYLRDSPVKGGAKILEVGVDDQSIRLAISKSKSRRELYESGRYSPVVHALVWSRRDLLSSKGE